MNKLLSVLRRIHLPDVGDLSAYLDGALAPSRAASLEAHLATCAVCRNRLEDLQDVRASLALLPEVDAPRSYRLQPSQVVREREPARARSFVYAIPALGAAAVVALAVLIAIDLRAGGSGRTGDGRTAFTAQKAAENATGVAGTAAAASSADRAAGAFDPSPAAGKSLDQNTAASPFAPNAAAPSNAAPVPGSPEALQTLADSSSSSSAPSPTPASDALRIAPPPQTVGPLTAGDVATALSGTPVAMVTREQPSKSGGRGIGALRIGELVAGVVIVVMGGITVGMLRPNRSKA